MTWFKNLKVRNKLLVAFMLVLVIAVCSNVFTLIQFGRTDTAFSDGINLTQDQFDHVFDVKDSFAKARMLIRDIYFPDNTMESLLSLRTELDSALVSAVDELYLLRETAPEGLRINIDTIIPLLERYRKDSAGVIGLLINIGYVDIENADYRNAMHNAQNETNRMTDEYAGHLTEDITNLSGLLLNELQSLSTDLSNSTSRTQVMIIIVLAIMAAVIIIVALYIPVLISKPLSIVTVFMKRANTTGDLSLSQDDIKIIEKYSKIEDEIGQLIGATAAFVKQISNVSEKLRVIADGDLTADFSVLSEMDEMGVALRNMGGNLNKMFKEINNSSSLVTSGSKQISDGAQMLSQASTEQAASVQELSSSITQISEQTKVNAELAEKAHSLSDSIMQNAEKGGRQMDEMMTAVREINTASQSISKVIKVIDDIAFQTNILALNAAVEAARAGQHGKGFAVVAEEVRNLAGKSAEAAKETGDMIQNSMEKAELGSHIAGETAVSFKEISTGIQESSRLVAEIAASSREQAMGISQVNIGIDQVAQVVQQNSATAQENAATSEEMSGQSELLKDLISQFKLK